MKYTMTTDEENLFIERNHEDLVDHVMTRSITAKMAAYLSYSRSNPYKSPTELRNDLRVATSTFYKMYRGNETFKELEAESRSSIKDDIVTKTIEAVMKSGDPKYYLALCDKMKAFDIYIEKEKTVEINGLRLIDTTSVKGKLDDSKLLAHFQKKEGGKNGK